jgi:dihydrolipoamide dehydrogenase
MPDTYDVLILGGGPGGYVCAIRAGQLGLKVACIDKRPTLGGTCLNIGCIPSKVLLESSERFAEMGKLDRHGIIVGQAKLDLAKMLARKNKIVDDLTKGVAFLFKKYKVTFLQGTDRQGPGRTSRREGRNNSGFGKVDRARYRQRAEQLAGHQL